MDTLTAEQRSKRMSLIRSKDTLPEMKVRRMLHRLGYRFRLHRKDLPGKPDLVFVGRRKVVFVHGCYWHGHGCRIGRPAKSNVEFWGAKIEANRARDTRNAEALKSLGWDVMVVWQCELRNANAIQADLVTFLGPPIISDRQGPGPSLSSIGKREHHDR
jgi:DNA mismatch endonuclease (patch repair protein)